MNEKRDKAINLAMHHPDPATRAVHQLQLDGLLDLDGRWLDDDTSEEMAAVIRRKTRCWDMYNLIANAAKHNAITAMWLEEAWKIVEDYQ